MDRKERIKDLLEQAASLGRDERERFLARECGDDAELRREVEELLAADETSSRLEDSVAFYVGAEDKMLGKLLGDQYVLKEELGAGGMGKVYLAEEKNLPRKVAVKIFEQGFAKEVEALARINSNHVVKIFTTGETDDGRPYMVMEYLTGETLDKLLAREGRLPENDAAQLMLKISGAVTELHETGAEVDGQGIIHRDLKPSNIMVERRRAGWEIKLFDLGVARLQNPLMGKSVSTHVAAGTPLYMAPEQYYVGRVFDFPCQVKSQEEIISPRTDVYALGVIAYEMLAGRHPLRDIAGLDKVPEMQEQNRRVEALDSRGEIPAAVRRVVLKAMAFCPEQRYQRAVDFGEELAAALTSTARSSSRIKYVSVAAVVLLMLLSFGAFMWRSSAPLPVATQPTATPPVAPQPEVTYWLVTQQTRDRQLVGESKVITSQDSVIGGWNLKLYLKSRERGYLYLINDAASATGRSLQLLFPIPYELSRDGSRNNGTSEVAPGQTVEAFDGVVGGDAGTEHLWIIWSLQRVDELERLTVYANSEHQGKVTGRGSAESVRAFLSKFKQADVKYDEQGYAILSGEGNVLVKELLLRHG